MLYSYVFVPNPQKECLKGTWADLGYPSSEVRSSKVSRKVHEFSTVKLARHFKVIFLHIPRSRHTWSWSGSFLCCLLWQGAISNLQRLLLTFKYPLNEVHKHSLEQRLEFTFPKLVPNSVTKLQNRAPFCPLFLWHSWSFLIKLCGFNREEECCP